MAKSPSNKASFRSAILADGIELIYFSGNHWDDILYFPSQYQIGRVVGGAGTFFVRNEPQPLRSGDVYTICPGLLHSGKPDPQGWAVEVLHVRPDLVERITVTLYGKPVLPAFTQVVLREPDSAQAIHQLFTDLLAALDQPQPALERESQVLDAVIQVVELCIGGEPTPLTPIDHPAVARARQFLTHHLSEAVSLDELADAACLSKFHLLRLFRAEFGLTPHAYQIQLRLNEARRLMFSGLSLTEVALALGFADQAHFTNTFSRYADLGPRDLLKTAIFFNFRE